MSIQNQKYTGQNAKNYSRNINQKALEQAKQVAKGLSAEERAMISSQNHEASRIIAEEERIRKEREMRARNRKKHRKLRPQAAALLAAVGLGGLAIGTIGPKVIRGYEKAPVSNDKSYIEESDTNIEQLPTDENLSKAKSNNDKITYVIDFNDFANPDAEITIKEMLDSNKVGALILKAGGTGYDYPFAIRNFDEEEIVNDMSPYSGEVSLSGNMGKIEDLEKYVHMAMDKDIAVGFYYYTCANTYREADMEAAYIKSFYNKLEKDIPNLDEAKLMPITIDIEDAGPEREGRNLSEDEIASIRGRRTDAVRHLVKDLSENGVVENSKGVIIYGDLNRVAEKTHVNWQNLYNGIEQDGTKVIQWGTRALPQTFDNAITYTSTSRMMGDLMDDKMNLSYMNEAYGNKYNDLLKQVAIMQIHLDEEITNGPNWSQMYDISQTSQNTIDAIVNGSEIDYGDGFVLRMNEVHNKSNEKKQGTSKFIDMVNIEKAEDYDR